jgi:hypothetical protein
MKVAAGGGAGRGGSVRSMGASWATDALGVMGDTGGRFGDADSERWRDRSEVIEASLEEAGRASVPTSRAGMAAGWTTTPGAEPDSLHRFPGGCCKTGRKGRSLSGPGLEGKSVMPGSADEDRWPAWWRQSGGAFQDLGHARPCQMPNARCEMRDARCKMQDARCKMPCVERVAQSVYRVQPTRFTNTLGRRVERRGKRNFGGGLRRWSARDG